MPLPHDSIFVTETSDSPEDPFGFFPSENQKTVRVRTRRVFYALARRVGVLAIVSLVRFFSAIARTSRRVVRFALTACTSAVSVIRGLRRPVWRFPTWRLPAWQLPRWQLPRWQLPAWRDGARRARVAWVTSQARPVISHIAARIPLSAVTISAFACGVVVGGSAVWLSGLARQSVRVESTTSPQTPREIPRAASPVAPVATAFANTPVVQAAHSATPVATRTTATRRPQFRGSLVVNSRPSGARVFVNGRNVGQTPLVLKNQPAGSRAIRVALEGYEPWSTAVQVVADTETQLRAELRAQRPAAQP